MKSILSECPKDIFETIRYLTLARGDILTLQDENDENVYIILSGIVRVYNLLPDGSYLPISTYNAGDFIGEMEAILQKTALHMVRASEKTDVAVISQENFLKWVKSDNNLCYLLLRKAEERLSNRGKQLVLSQQLSKADLIWMTVYLSKNPLTKSDLIESTSASARTVDRQLHKGIESGWINIVDGKIHILNIDSLKSHCLGLHISMDL